MVDSESESHGDVEIVHTHAAGTLASGTKIGDGSAEILKHRGWRWSRQLDSWYLPRSRDRVAKRSVIEATSALLAAAGFKVAVSIDDTATRSMDELESDLATRAKARGELLEQRAVRQWSSADSAWAASRRISDHIPLGQPILVGHHSERRHRRDLERIQDLASKSMGISRLAEENERRAERLSGQTERRYTPAAVGARLERLERALRRVVRQLNGYRRVVGGLTEVHEPASGHWAEQLKVEQADLEEQVEYWRAIQDDLAATGPSYSQDSIHKGDFVRISGHWRKVVRANKKTVSVETGYSWTDSAPYYKVTEHRPGAEVDGPHV